MRKPIRITESDLQRIVNNSVRRALKEDAVNEGWKDWGKTAALGAGLGAAAAGVVGTDNPVSRGLDRQFADQEKVSRAFPEDREEFGDALGPQKPLPSDTISWEKANQFESKIGKAITESITKFINELSHDTLQSAADKSIKKIADTESKYGKNSYVADRARNQKKNFEDRIGDEWREANSNKKARIQKNNIDRRNGERTYVKGKGWRTQQGEE